MPPINGRSVGPFYEDVLISFAAEDHGFAQLLGRELQHLGRAVRMDFVDEWRIFAADPDQYVAPIHDSAVKMVVAVLGREYGLGRWGLIVSSSLLSSGYFAAIPVWSTTIPRAQLARMPYAAGFSFDPTAADLPDQARQVAVEIDKQL
jgi:hypothetical protein